MGAFQKLGVALSATAGWLGLSSVPEDDPGRLARIAELYAGYEAGFPSVSGISVADLLARQAAGESWVLVDTRTDRERAVSVLPGAITKEVVEQDPSAYVGRNVVAYCTIGYRSGLWAAEMADKGLTVYNLEGSALAWTHAGGALQTPSGTATHDLHVYGPTWDLARTDYQSVW